MRLREQIVKANLLVREASYIAEELDKRTEYKVTLQIPASSLDANRKVRLPLMEKTKLLLDKISSVLFRCGGGGVCPCPHPCPLPLSRIYFPSLIFVHMRILSIGNILSNATRLSSSTNLFYSTPFFKFV